LSGRSPRGDPSLVLTVILPFRYSELLRVVLEEFADEKLDFLLAFLHGLLELKVSP
jgi:hypothetical protein